jgi:hypothetical protein
MTLVSVGTELLVHAWYSPSHTYPPTYVAKSVASTMASTARIGAAVEGREVIEVKVLLVA